MVGLKNIQEGYQKMERDKKGKFMKGHQVLEEWRNKVSEARKGKHNSLETEFKKGHKPIFTKKRNLKISKALTGRKLSEETKQKLRKPKSEKHKRKLSLVFRKNYEEGIRVPYWTNKKRDSKTNKKISKSLKENYNKGILKCMKYWEGKKLSKEHKINISEAMKESEKVKENRAKQIFPIKDTKIEVKIQNFLKRLGIPFFTHQYMSQIKHSYQCDILIPSMNLVIECDGNYWHKYPIGNELDHIRTLELLEKWT